MAGAGWRAKVMADRADCVIARLRRQTGEEAPMFGHSDAIRLRKARRRKPFPIEPQYIYLKKLGELRGRKRSTLKALIRNKHKDHRGRVIRLSGRRLPVQRASRSRKRGLPRGGARTSSTRDTIILRLR